MRAELVIVKLRKTKETESLRNKFIKRKISIYCNRIGIKLAHWCHLSVWSTGASSPSLSMASSVVSPPRGDKAQNLLPWVIAISGVPAGNKATLLHCGWKMKYIGYSCGV